MCDVGGMSALSKIVAAHPLSDEYPYNRIKFARLNQHGKPVYKVGKGKTEFGAERGLRVAFARFGGKCFHCREEIEKSEFTLDHLRPKRDGGEEHIHNLVFACRPCNWSKGAKHLAHFEANIATHYLTALDKHLARCIKEMAKG